jgi:hypothetical protein
VKNLNVIAAPFADNSIIVAAANIGGILGLLVLTYQFVRGAVRFIKSTYSKNIRIAILRARRRSFMRAFFVARDLHLFVATLASYALTLFFATICLVILGLSSPGDGLLSQLNGGVPVFSLGIGRIVFQILAALGCMAGVLFFGLRAANLIFNVTRLRIKWERRRLRGIAADRHHEAIKQ